jgi:hypothetical protein
MDSMDQQLITQFVKYIKHTQGLTVDMLDEIHQLLSRNIKFPHTHGSKQVLELRDMLDKFSSVL